MRSLYKHWVLDGRFFVETGDGTQGRLRTVDEVAGRIVRSERIVADLLDAIGAAPLLGMPQQFTLSHMPPLLRQQVEQLATSGSLVVTPTQLALPSFQALCTEALGADARVRSGLLVAIKPVRLLGSG
jgi:hypothetical protein